jgi:hypothetical protein
MNKRAHLNDVDVRVNQLLNPPDFLLGRDDLFFHLKPVPWPHLMKDDLAHRHLTPFVKGNPKFEYRNPKQSQNPKFKCSKHGGSFVTTEEAANRFEFCVSVI